MISAPPEKAVETTTHLYVHMYVCVWVYLSVCVCVCEFRLTFFIAECTNFISRVFFFVLLPFFAFNSVLWPIKDDKQIENCWNSNHISNFSLYCGYYDAHISTWVWTERERGREREGIGGGSDKRGGRQTARQRNKQLRIRSVCRRFMRCKSYFMCALVCKSVRVCVCNQL